MMICSRTCLATLLSICWRVRMRSGKLFAGLGEIFVGDHAAFVGYGLERVGALLYGNFGVAAAIVPSKFLSKEGFEGRSHPGIV